MPTAYNRYLQSEQWKQKRAQRFKEMGRYCAACGSSDVVQMHHLTYVRIFDEDTKDLLPLCRVHHEMAEELYKAGKLKKKGGSKFLRRKTIRLLTGMNQRQLRQMQHMPVDPVALIANFSAD